MMWGGVVVASIVVLARLSPTAWVFDAIMLGGAGVATLARRRSLRDSPPAWLLCHM
jgi:hypothetical protein